MEKALENTPNNYSTHLDWTGIRGWSGWNILNISDITTYGKLPGSQYGRIRFIFRQTAITTIYSAANISIIMGFGGVGWITPSNMAKTGHLYSYDNAQNATFPAQVTATQFNGNATNVTGVVAIDHGGTGKNNAKDAANQFINALDTGSSTPGDADYYISQYAGGGTTTTTYHRRPMSALWEYIKGKISSILGLTATTYSGSAAKVNNHTVNSDVPANAEFTDTTDLGSMTGSLTVDHLSPMMSKTFTGVVGTANTDVDCTFFFGTVKPISYYDIWKIKYRVHIHITGNASTNNQYAEARSEATWFGSENTYQAYHHLNHIHSTSYRPAYYNTLYNLKKAGVDAGLGHALGIGLRNSWNAYNSSYPREITI